ncbi:MAG: hypothetical protein ACXW1A_05440 [Nitrososphaeraceae archaeon]
MKLKKKRKWVWCTQIALNIDKDISNAGYMNKHRGEINVPSKIKCPLCKKRFKPRIRTCGDNGCWHVYVPPHKKLE